MNELNPRLSGRQSFQLYIWNLNVYYSSSVVSLSYQQQQYDKNMNHVKIKF